MTRFGLHARAPWNLTAVGLGLMFMWGVVAAAAPPPATIIQWPAMPVVGNDPTMTRIDVDGVTGMVDSPTSQQPNVTAYENMSGGGHSPCGMLHWNPETNLFCWFGWTGGVDRDIRITPGIAPPKVNATGGFPVRTFRGGDVWNVVEGSAIACHFQGTGALACKGLDPLDEAETRQYTNVFPKAVAIDGVSYYVWVTTTLGDGSVHRLDPETNDVMHWVLPGGGTQYNIEVDATGIVWFTVGPPDRVVRLDPATSTFTEWPVPGGGFGPGVGGYIANAITFSEEGDVVFAETASGEVAVLNPVTNELCEVGGGVDTRMAVSSGTRALGDRQFYATEHDANHITLITESELVPACQTCTIVPPTSTIVSASSFTAIFVEAATVPTSAVITPSSYLVLPATCGPEGPVACASDERLTGVMRYSTTVSDTGPAAITAVVTRADGTKIVFGSFGGSDNLYGFQTCALLPSRTCGDGTLDPGEDCDDGNTMQGDGCRGDCTIKTCGDGILDTGEGCDDGNTMPGDGCSSTCTVESSCLTSTLSVVANLKGVKSLPLGARFSWSPDPPAVEYHLNSVSVKADLVDPHMAPAGSGDLECEDPPLPLPPSCIDADALDTAVPRIFYQVFSACGDTGADEGPF